MEELSTDLWMLVAAAVWCVGLTGALMVGRVITPGGATWGLSNRDQAFSGPAWLDRAGRAHQNMVENLAPFAALVLVVHVTGRASDVSALAALVFMASRVLHSVFYLAGLVPWRTIAHTLSVGAQITLLIVLMA